MQMIEPLPFLESIALLLVCSIVLYGILKKLRIPPLVGLILLGIVMSKYAFNIMSGDILKVSQGIRELALIIILTRAGLSLSTSDLKKVGRVGIMLCFVPALVELITIAVVSILLLNLSFTEGALLGSVLAAVSPAVVVPRMLKLKKEGYGVDKGIPQAIMAGSSCDDVFVIIIFTALLAKAATGSADASFLWHIPVSIILGIIVGLISGKLFSLIFKKIHIRDTFKVLILISMAIVFVSVQNLLETYLGVPYSGMLSVIVMGLTFSSSYKNCAKRMSKKYSKIWVIAELFLFVLVGCEVNLEYAFSNEGLMLIPVILIAMVFRMGAVFVCTMKTKMNLKERIYCAIAYSPKATVQAAIGGVALGKGIGCGQLILNGAVWAIMITAPIGAFMMDLSYKLLLNKNESHVAHKKYIQTARVVLVHDLTEAEKNYDPPMGHFTRMFNRKIMEIKENLFEKIRLRHANKNQNFLEVSGGQNFQTNGQNYQANGCYEIENKDKADKVS